MPERRSPVRGRVAVACAALLAAPGASLAMPGVAISLPMTAAEPPTTAPAVADASLDTVVMWVRGSADYRIGDAGAWTAVAEDGVIPTGATLRTSMKTEVGLRIGLNATVVVNSYSRVTIHEASASEEVLTTFLKLDSGDMMFRVDHVGRDNDFRVLAPGATLSVRGTWGRVRYDSFGGFAVRGVNENTVRSMEVRFTERNTSTTMATGSLGGGDRSPTVAALRRTHARQDAGVTDQTRMARAFQPLQQESVIRETGVDLSVRGTPRAGLVQNIETTATLIDPTGDLGRTGLTTTGR